MRAKQFIHMRARIDALCRSCYRPARLPPVCGSRLMSRTRSVTVAQRYWLLYQRPLPIARPSLSLSHRRRRIRLR